MAVTDTPAPMETTPQHMDALARAQQVRAWRTAIKREVKAGQTTVRAALYDDRAGSLTVLELLLAQTRWGKTRALRVLRAVTWLSGEAVPVTIAENKRVDALSDRQRRALGRAVMRSR